ncbi:WSC domain-containing protein [Colletotrichum karsti]|uniref:WSC domain-containing protein n=1 Tax=Colletotrichum karsti TaxID=1095194 RepID=A0A9P6HYN2_9PEZI|nr:WSC domain-containing protein [Colletotrichum karsti]KAF9874013.1 WSC domain-containing protein [Colletotrichum karsti]
MAPLFKALAALAAASLFTQVTATGVELPPCLSTFQPFVSSGCYADKGTKGEDALDFRSSIDQKTTTAESCAAECKGNGYRYAGLTYYGVCYCSATINSPKLDDSACTYECQGNQTETCGGPGAFSVWADTTFPTANGDVIKSYQSIGCWTDETGHGRTVGEPQKISADTMTPSNCIATCAAQGYPFAGVEFGQECYCGVVIGNYSVSTTADKCATPCKGDSTQTCGGAGTVEIYASQQLLSLEPCGYVPPANSPSSSVPVTIPVSSPSVESSTVPAIVTITPVTSDPPPPPATSSSSSISTDSPPPPVTTSATISSDSPPPPVTSSSSTSTTISSPAPPPPATSSTSTSITPKVVTPPTTSTTSTTSSKVTSQSPPPPPTTTSKVPTTQAPPPPATTPKPTPSTTAPAMCTTTIVTPATCEYGCGKWCNKNLPEFDDQESCSKASNRCHLQLNACYKNAGFPNSAACVDFKAWCKDVASYCSSSCSGKKGSCGKKDCFQKKVPKGYKPGTTSVSTFACPTKPTSTSTPVSVVPPPPTGLCKQPTSRMYGYGPGNPVGGIELPIVTCNDLKEEFQAGNQFKLYIESESKQCKGYGKGNVPNACADACQEQYSECQSTYVQGCKAYNNRRSGGAYSSAPEIAKRFFFADNYNAANNKCKAQLSDCLSENKNVLSQSKCGSFGTGY